MGNNAGWLNSGGALSTQAKALRAIGTPGGGGGGGVNWGTPALAVNFPDGVYYGAPGTITTDGTYNLGAGAAERHFEDLSGMAVNDTILTSNSSFDYTNNLMSCRSDSNFRGRSMRVWNGNNETVGQG